MATSIENNEEAGEEETWPTLIENKEELKENLKKFAKLVDDCSNIKDEALRKCLKKRIQLGHCFVVYKVAADEWHFAPSRFIGYKEIIPIFVDLFKQHHNKEVSKKCSSYFDLLKENSPTGYWWIDGRVTDERITEILGQKLITEDNASWEKWEKEYKKYCEKLQIKPSSKIQRKYWNEILD